MGQNATDERHRDAGVRIRTGGGSRGSTATDNLYFSDVHNGGVHRRRPDGTIETVVPKRRGVGGIALHADGGLVISGRNICHVRDGETRVVFAPDAPGLNDLFVDAAGTGDLRHDALRSVLDGRSAHGRVSAG